MARRSGVEALAPTPYTLPMTTVASIPARCNGKVALTEPYAKIVDRWRQEYGDVPEAAVITLVREVLVAREKVARKLDAPSLNT